MNGKTYIDNLLYDIGRYQVVATDTALRTVALSWLNRIVNDVSGRHRHWTWLEKTSTFATVATQMSYDLPTDIDLSGNKIFTLKQYTTPSKLYYINQKRFDELQPDPTSSSGDPYYYTMWAKSLRLWPVPSQAITMYLRYIKTITAMTDAVGSTSDIPAKWDEVVLDGMKKFAFSIFPEWGDVSKQTVIYESGIARMITDNNEELDNTPNTEGHSKSDIKDPYSFNDQDVG